MGEGWGGGRVGPVLTLRLMKPFRRLCRARAGCTRRSSSENRPCTFAASGKSVFMRVSIQGGKRRKKKLYQSLNFSLCVANLQLFSGGEFKGGFALFRSLKLLCYRVNWDYLTTAQLFTFPRWRRLTQGGTRRFRNEGGIECLSTRPSLFPLSWKISCQAAMRSLR